MALRVGTAYVDVLPRIAKNATSGIGSDLDRALEPAAAKAGKDAGESAGKGFSSTFADKVKGVAGLALGAGLGASVAGGLFSAIGQEADSDKLAASLGIQDPQFAADLGKSAGNLYANNFGDSLGGVNDALKSVVQAHLVPDDFEGDFSGAIESITGKALNLASVFGTDVSGEVQAASQLIRTGLVKNADEALDVITRGFQQGVDKRGDFLDTLNEYSTQFQKLGIDATTATGLLSQGLQGGARDADLVADALKEFSIRAVDGSTTTAAGFEAIGLKADEMTAKIAAGGPGAREGLDQVLNGLRGIEDPAKRAQAATALFGTQAEDLGGALYKLDTSKAATQLGTVAGAADKLGAQIGDNAGAKIETFKRKAIGAFVSVLGGQVLPILEKTADWLGRNKTVMIAAGIGITAALVPAFIAWAAAAIPAAAATVIAAAPVIALGVAVGALALLIIKNWDTIKGAFGAAKDFIVGVVGDVISFVEGVPGKIGRALSSVASTISGAFSSAWDLAKGVVSGAISWLGDTFGGIGRLLGEAMKGVTNVITLPYRLAFNAIADLWNNTVGKLSFKIPGWVPGIGGKGFDVPDIPKWEPRARGGPVLSGHDYVVGELGPELFRPGVSGSIVPNSALGALEGSGRGIQVALDVDARGAPDPWRVGRTINRTLRELAYAEGF